MYPKRDKN